MAKQTEKSKAAIAIRKKVAANQKFHARLIFKSGAVQDLLVVAESATVFEAMWKAYLAHLNGTGPAHGMFSVNGAVACRSR